MSYDRIFGKLLLVFMLIFIGALIALDRGITSIQIQIISYISAFMVMIMLCRVLWITRENLYKQFNESPWAGGFICGLAITMVVDALSPSYYINLESYSIAILSAPLAAFIAMLIAYSRMIYVNKETAKKKELEDKSQHPI